MELTMMCGINWYRASGWGYGVNYEAFARDAHALIANGRIGEHTICPGKTIVVGAYDRPPRGDTRHCVRNWHRACVATKIDVQERAEGR